MSSEVHDFGGRTGGKRESSTSLTWSKTRRIGGDIFVVQQGVFSHSYLNVNNELFATPQSSSGISRSCLHGSIQLQAHGRDKALRQSLLDI